MEFFDKLGKKASQACKMTANKTSKIAKETKLKLKMNDLKSEISDIYEKIGKKVYEKYIREENISIKQELESECTKIEVLSDEIEELLQQCLSLNDKKQCLNCYKQIDKEYNFCPNCGKKQTDEQIKEEKILEKVKNAEVEEDNKTEKNIVIEELQDDIKEKKNKFDDKKEAKTVTQVDNKENDEKELTNLEKTIFVESNIDTNENDEDDE